MGKEGSSGWYTDEKRGSLLCAVDYGQKMKRVVYTVHKSVKRGEVLKQKKKKRSLFSLAGNAPSHYSSGVNDIPAAQYITPPITSGPDFFSIKKRISLMMMMMPTS